LFAEGCKAYGDTDRVVVFSAPLLVETGMHTAFEVLVVVSTTVDTQVERLMRERGMSEDAVRVRIAVQAPLEDKAAVADVLIDNEGSLEELEAQVERAWADLAARAGG
jgi:dephospho-CoA kinase